MSYLYTLGAWLLKGVIALLDWFSSMPGKDEPVDIPSAENFDWPEIIPNIQIPPYNPKSDQLSQLYQF